VQISAVVSVETKELLDHYSAATGVKKGRLIEDALRHHLQALGELPAEAIITPRITLTRESGDRLLEQLASETEPTDALRELLKQDAD